MHRLILLACLALAACATSSALPKGGYRQAAAPIYSNAGFDVAQLAGTWNQIAGFSKADPPGCEGGHASFTPQGATLRVSYALCLSGKMVSEAGVLVETGPGRFAIKGARGLGADWWVLWVDEGYRTLAIGTPSGAFGFILNTGAALPADRLNAAKELFDFNGYATQNLVVFRAAQ